MTTPPHLARQQKRVRRSLQSGTLLSFTTVSHPPARFGHEPRTVGLIALDDGSKVMGVLRCTPIIGMRLQSRLRLNSVNSDGLRIYEPCFEEALAVPAPVHSEFPGYIVALTGPSGVGKTTIQRMLISMFSEIVDQVPIMTTRERKAGDDGEYRYISKKKFAEYLEGGEMVASTLIPSSTEDRWYGYRRGDIDAIWKKGKIPVVVTEMHLLQGLAIHFGRRSILSFGLLPPGKSRRAMLSTLFHRLRLRGRESEAAIRDRVTNATRDLAFFLERKDLFDHLVVNDETENVIAALQQHVPNLSE